MTMIRLDKYLANAGVGTRTQVKGYIKKGMVKVNGITTQNPEQKIDDTSEKISLSGKTITNQTMEYYMLHKPVDCVSATQDNLHQTVMDFITSGKKSELFPVGRLDKDTEGLLLITNDGELAHFLLSPKRHVPKTYLARIAGPLKQKDVAAFEKGLDIGEEKQTLPAVLEILSSGAISEAKVTICEGKFHQIKRMFHSVGKEVFYLKRLSMGSLVLDEALDKGEARPLSREEIQGLYEETGGGTSC